MKTLKSDFALDLSKNSCSEDYLVVYESYINGYYVAKDKNNKYGIVDVNNNVIIPFEYFDIHDYTYNDEDRV